MLQNIEDIVTEIADELEEECELENINIKELDEKEIIKKIYDVITELQLEITNHEAVDILYECEEWGIDVNLEKGDLEMCMANDALWERILQYAALKGLPYLVGYYMEILEE